MAHYGNPQTPQGIAKNLHRSPQTENQDPIAENNYIEHEDVEPVPT